MCPKFLLSQAAHVLWPAYGSASLQVELYVREQVRVAKVSDTLSCRLIGQVTKQCTQASMNRQRKVEK